MVAKWGKLFPYAFVTGPHLRVDGGGTRWLSIGFGVMIASELCKLYWSPAACPRVFVLLIPPVCCIEYASSIGVMAQTDGKPYFLMT